MLLIPSPHASHLRLKQACKLAILCYVGVPWQRLPKTMRFVLQNKVNDFDGLKYCQNLFLILC